MAVMKLDKTSVENILPLTPIQQGMLFHYLNEPSSGHYIEQLSLNMQGTIDVPRLKEAWQFVCASNEMLRTVFRWEGLDNPLQIVLKHKELTVTVHNFSNDTGDQLERKVQELREADRAKKFDLQQEVIRLAICLKSKQSCELIITNHHIIYDGWSTGILLREFLDSYDKLVSGRVPERPVHKSEYKQFVQWLTTKDKNEGLRYWRTVTEQIDSRSLLPQDGVKKEHATVAESENRKAVYIFNCANDGNVAVEKLARRCEVTPAAVFYTVWGLMLGRYNRQHNVLFGTTVSGRTSEIKGIEHSVGLYINTLPLRVSCYEGDQLLDVVRRVHNCLIERQEYEYVSLQDIVTNQLETGADLFQSIVVIENYPLERVLNEKSRAVRIASYHMHEWTHYDFAVQINSLESDRLEVQFTYNEALFSKSTVERFAGHFRHILQQLIAHPQLAVSELELVQDEEKQELLEGFSRGIASNWAACEMGHEPCIHAEFERQEAMSEHKLALVYSDGSLTYGEVNRRANQLARQLQVRGVTQGDVVAVRMQRSPEMIIGLLAVLKAGASYLPVLPDFPKERVAYMLSDSGSSLLLTHLAVPYLDHVAEGIDIIYADDMLLYEGDSSNLGVAVKGHDLAYIIYTSGSTGLPKGVAVEHRSVHNTLQAMERLCPLGEHDTFLLKTTFTFDVSVCELFGWFQGGGRLAILDPGGEKEPSLWMDAIRAFNVTHVNFVPSLLTFMMQELTDKQLERLRSLRYILAAGEALKPALAEAVQSRLPHVRLFNLYGPTEAAIYATYYEVTTPQLSSSVPIGRPLDNMHIYILDHDGKLCPKGVLGELCIAGVGVARGYLNRNDLTSAVFKEDPFNQARRMYRTGDLARWLPDGVIEYAGRTDHQVKVRGYRIEPGEIEACLVSHPTIQEAAVVHRVNNRGETYLCAFYTANLALQSSDIRGYISSKLPVYMVPAYLEQLSVLPLTPSGKIDRKSLPEGIVQSGTTTQFESPTNDIQQILIQVWEEVLGVSGIGIGHSFIELGGDSIKAMKVASRLLKYKYQLEIKYILLYPKIRELSLYVTSVKQMVIEEAQAGAVKLMPIQQLFFERIKTDRHHFNQSFMLFSDAGLDASLLQQALNVLTEQHDALRIVFRISDSKVEQINRPIDSGGCDFAVVNLAGGSDIESRISALADECQSSIDLQNGPLMKARLFKTDEGDHLLLVIHHLVVDGVSWRVIVEDLATAYGQLAEGKAVDLGTRNTSFRQWSESLHAYAKSDQLRKEIDYWRTLEEMSVAPLSIINRTGRSSNRICDTEVLTIRLSEESTSSLLQDAHAAYHTQVDDFLIAALGTTFKRLTGQERLLLHLEGHGRQEVIKGAQIHRTVGWFTSMYPIILDMSNVDFSQDEASLSSHIRATKEMLRQIPHKGIGYGVLKYLSPSEIKESIPFQLQPEVSFNYLGQFDQDLQQGPFILSPLPTGREVSANLEREASLEIYGMVKEGHLVLNWVYNKNQISADVMQQLTDSYLQELQHLLEHTRKVTKPCYTPSDFPYASLNMSELDGLTAKCSSREQEVENLYTLSPLQEGLLFHAQLDTDSHAYVQQIAFRASGVLHVNQLDWSLQQLFARYEALRTQIVHVAVTRPHQIVLRQQVSSVREVDVSHLAEEAREQAISDYMNKDRDKGFKLDQEPLLRVTVFLLGNESWHLLWTYHHIIMDGWCAASLFKQLFTLYREGPQAVLEPVAPYSRYMEWLTSKNKEDAQQFWRSYLADYEERASFPRRVQPSVSYERRELQLLLTTELTQALEKTACAYHTTLYTVIQAVWGTMLQRYSGSRDVIFGSVVSGRSPEVEGMEYMAGLFINTVPVRVRMEKGERFSDMLDRLRRINAEASAYEYCPLADIQVLASFKQELFNHLLIFENYPLDMETIQGSDASGRLQIHDVQVVEQTSYDLDVTVIPDEHLCIKFSYNIQVYDHEFIEQLATCFQNLIEQITAHPERVADDLELMTAAEKTRLIEAYNETDAELPTHPAHEWFEAQVANGPERTAVRYNGKDICYAELNARANQLARYLLAQRSEREELIAILMDRSPEMLVAIVAIWKAGGAYVPVDPGYPAERQRTILRESGVRFIVGDAAGVSGLEWGTDELSVRVILLDQEAEAIAQQSADNLGLPVQLSQLAYVIYTSGSTGMPKGTMIEHAGMLNHILAEIEEMQITADTVLAQNASHCFDISVWQFVAALTVGGVTAIYPNELVLEPVLFTAQIIRDQVSILEVVPSYLSVMMDYMEAAGVRPTALHYLMITGETVKPAMVRRWFEICPDIRMVNAYGPAEAADDISHYVMDKPLESDPVPIGKPIRNMRIYIVDDQLQLCPIGMVGEICVSGVGVGRGYLRDPERTASVFLEDPFREKRGVRMYRTGDLGRRLPDGNIEFFGRKDYQVKIRGFRIELGEIEARLAEYERVKEAVVLDVEDEQGMKQLAAYVTFAGEGKPEAEELKGYLACQLPAYMVPASVQVLDELPLTPNGKIDRKALPKPELGFGSMAAGGAPQTETERELASIWQEVLGVVEVGRELSFFEAGGHSLKAMTLVSRIHKELDVEMPLREVFARPQLHRQAAYIEQAARETYSHIPQAPKLSYYPASSSQKRLFALSQMDDSGMSYNITMTYTLLGQLDIDRLQQAWKQVLVRHEALRTSFAYLDGELVQRIDDQAGSNIELMQIIDAPMAGLVENTNQEPLIDKQIQAFFQPFDLQTGPLVRAGLMPLSTNEHILLIDIHHTIADGTSLPLMMRELCAIYEGEVLSNVSIHYKDYVYWQQKETFQRAQAKHESYWLNELAGELPVLDLVTDYPRPAARSFEGDHVRFGLDEELTNGLRSLASETGTTLYTVLLAAFSVLLSKYTGTENMLIGSPVAGRTHTDLDQMVGMFVNTVVIRSQPNMELTFRELISQVHNYAMHAFEHQDYPFEQLVDKLGLQRDASRNPIFDVLFILQNVDRSSLVMGPVTVEPYDYLHRTAKFDLTLFAAEEHEGISAGFEYCSKLFHRDTMDRMAKHYKRLLNGIVNSSGNERLALLHLMTTEERVSITTEFATNRYAIQGSSVIHQRFEEQAQVRPTHTAIYYKDQACTYGDLNARANQLARKIRSSHLIFRKANQSYIEGDGLLVGIMVDNPVDRITAVLAVLKAGFAYVPIDPSYPQERIAHMVLDSGLQLILSDVKDVNELLPQGVEVLPLQLIQSAVEETANLDLDVQADDLAYLIYTSGSTGQPKGVAINHSSLVNFIAWRTEAYEIGADDCNLQLISFSFDGYGANLYTALMTGGSLVAVDDGQNKDFNIIVQYVIRYGVTSFSVIPSMYQALLDFAKPGDLEQLRRVVLAAERPSDELIARSRRMLPRTLLINEYGPTENTIATTAQIGIDVGRTAVIGRPVGNHEIYLLDRAGFPVPIGIPGELYAAGPGLARGYWKRPEMTAEKFVVHAETGKRMYRTGDMGRWMKDGSIEFLGRLDEQVKIRGFRIELEEIAARLRMHPTVVEAVVADRKNAAGQLYLCAYIVPNAGADQQGDLEKSYTVQPALASAYKSFLAKALPDYMIPAYFMHLEKLPLSPNGKLARKELPAPDMERVASELYEAPRTEMEMKLAEIWQQVLGIPRVGIRDHFFDLGGDSIKAIQVSSRLHQQGFVLDMKHLFQHPVLTQLALYIKQDGELNSQEEVVGETNLTAIQHWFFSQQFNEMHHFNQAIMLYRSSGFDIDVLRLALTAITKHHDALRMVFKRDGDRWTARNRSVEEGDLFILNEFDTSGTREAERRSFILQHVDEAQRSLNLEEGPLFRLTLFRTVEGDHLHLVVHHLVVDGVSWRILLEDLATAYTQAERRESVQLPAKTMSVKEWAGKVYEYAEHPMLLKEIPYWQELEDGYSGTIQVDGIFGQRRPEEQLEVVMECTLEETEQLLKHIHRTYNTEINDILLTALALAFYQWSGNVKTLIHLEGHGREKLDRAYNISRTVGWFTAQYPVLLHASRLEDVGYVLKSIKDSLRKIPNRGIGYGLLEYVTPLELRKKLQFGLQPAISFNYLGQTDQTIDSEVFTMSEFGSGTNISPHARKLYAMEWTGMVVDGRLRMTVSYSSDEFHQTSISKLLNLYHHQLKNIVNHCLGKSGTEVSPSDLVYNKLSIDKLSQISSLLNKKLK